MIHTSVIVIHSSVTMIHTSVMVIHTSAMVIHTSVLVIHTSGMVIYRARCYFRLLLKIQLRTYGRIIRSIKIETNLIWSWIRMAPFNKLVVSLSVPFQKFYHLIKYILPSCEIYPSSAQAWRIIKLTSGHVVRVYYILSTLQRTDRYIRLFQHWWYSGNTGNDT